MMSGPNSVCTVSFSVIPGPVAALAHRTTRLSWLLLLGAMLCLLAACGTTQKVGPGYYRVQSGDTLTQIAREHGQTVHSLMRMNDIRNANVLRVGQILKVGTGGASATSSGSSTSPSAPSPVLPRPANAIDMIWPADGSVDARAKKPSPHGIVITNRAGTPIKAVADGKVVYAGDALRGYGNLVIVDHASGFLTVYAHNQSLDVKEGQRVKQGQRIAAMGSSASNQVGLYFEVRYQGKAVDALRYLPRR